MKKQELILIFIQISAGILSGTICYSILSDLSLFHITLIHFAALFGISLPGYFYLLLQRSTHALIYSIFSGATCIMFGTVIYVIFAYFIFSSYEILHNQFVALAIPVIAGVFGFNKFAFNVKPAHNTR